MSEPLLQTRGLGMRFGGLQAVEALDLHAHAGEILGLIGPNGAGKSTTFNLVAGAMRPTSGSIHFEGHAMVGRPTHAFAQRGILRTFQHNKPFASMSLADNVKLGMHTRLGVGLWQVLAAAPAARQAEARAARRAEELLDFVGLGEWLQADVATLSFGQGRLLEIARVLAGEPRLILFDEPAAGLTAAECERLGGIIRRIAAQGIAVLLIEHDMHFLMPLADRVAVLNFGRKIADGPPGEVQAHEEVIRAYLGDVQGLAHA